MPYLSGLVTGIIATILIVFVIDHIGDEPGSRDIVNWNVVAESIGAGAEKVTDEVRQGINEATEPGPEGDATPDTTVESSAPAEPDTTPAQ